MKVKKVIHICFSMIVFIVIVGFVLLYKHNNKSAKNIFNENINSIVEIKASTNIENLGKYEINGLENLFNNVYGNQTVRSYLSTLSFDEQYSFGIQILKLLGVTL